MGNLKYRSDGDGIGRIAVEVAKGGLLLTPRLSFIGGGQGSRYPSPGRFFCRAYEEVDAGNEFDCRSEFAVTAGLAVSRSLERRWFAFAVGGAFDVGWLGRYGNEAGVSARKTDAVFSFSADATIGARMSSRVLLFLELDTGLWLERQALARTLAPDPFVSLLAGVRVEL
jgi:hypothetical protein